MKKRLIFIAILVVAIACLLSISIFADAYDANRTSIEYTDVNGNLHTVPVVKFDDGTVANVRDAISKNPNKRGSRNHEDSITKMADNSAYVILKNGDNYTAYPSWYIIDAVDDAGPEIYEICYGYINSKSSVTGITYSEGSIVYMEFPQGMTGVRNNGVFGNKGSPYETNVTEFHIPKTVKDIESSAFNAMPVLKRVYIEAGNSISKINSSTFTNCGKLEYIQFENLYLTSLDGIANVNIAGPVDLSHMTELTKLGDSCFRGSANLTTVTLPDSIETIGANVFDGCTNVYFASPYLPKNLKTIGIQFCQNAKNFNSLLIFPDGFEKIGDEPFQNMEVKGGAAGNEFNLVFLGKMQSTVYLNGNGHQKHAEKVTVYFAKNSLSDYNTTGLKIKPSGSSTTSVPGAIRAVFCAGNGEGTNGNVTGIEYVYITNTNGTSWTADYVNHAEYGFDFDNHTCFCSYEEIQKVNCGYDGIHRNTCIVCDEVTDDIVPATGNHKYTADKDCSTAELCDVCKLVAVEALEHDLFITLSYANGYASAGARREVCQREGCEHDVSSEPKALITLRGYSKNEAGSRMCVGYSINYASMTEYKAINNLESFEFGAVMSTLANAQNGSPLSVVDGAVVKNAPDTGKGSIIKADLTSKSCTAVEIAISGDYTNYQDLQILLCAYIYDGTALSYIQAEETDTIESVAIKDLPVVD